MHLADPRVGFVASTPIVGGSIPVGVGAALANQMKRNGLVTTIFMGDAAVEEGVFHESVGFAAVKKLGVVFFCENNLYSVQTPLKPRQPGRKISDLVSGHGIFTQRIDGNDVMAVYEASQKAVSYARGGEGPAFIEALTYRWQEHCGPADDTALGYRTPEELGEWKKRCPIERVVRELGSGADLNGLRAKIALEVDQAVAFAEKSPFPVAASVPR